MLLTSSPLPRHDVLSEPSVVMIAPSSLKVRSWFPTVSALRNSWGRLPPSLTYEGGDWVNLEFRHWGGVQAVPELGFCLFPMVGSRWSGGVGGTEGLRNSGNLSQCFIRCEVYAWTDGL